MTDLIHYATFGLVLYLAIFLTSTAYADEVIIQTTFPVVGYSCQEDNNGQFPYSECLIQGDDSFVGGDGISYTFDPVEEKYVPTDQLIEEAKKLYEGSLEPVIIPDLTDTERAIIQYERNDVTQLEKQIIILLEKQRSVCKVDILTVQTYGELQVPIEEFINSDGVISLQLVRAHIDTAFSLKNHPMIGKLLQDIEACRGQEALSYITGPQYENMVVDDEYSDHFEHKDMAQGMKPFKTQVLTEGSFQYTEAKAFNTICEGYHFSNNYKRDYGCFPDVEYHIGGSAPVVVYQSDAMDRYENFLENGDSEQLSKLQQESVHKKIRETFN